MNKFIERRKALGLTQEQLGKILGVSQVRISSCETGSSILSKSLRIRWMSELGITEDANDDRFLMLESLSYHAQFLTDKELECIEGIVKYLNQKKR
jgi:transcriptional regulator with XRE-family HTH domain